MNHALDLLNKVYRMNLDDSHLSAEDMMLPQGKITVISLNGQPGIYGTGTDRHIDRGDFHLFGVTTQEKTGWMRWSAYHDLKSALHNLDISFKTGERPSYTALVQANDLTLTANLTEEQDKSAKLLFDSKPIYGRPYASLNLQKPSLRDVLNSSEVPRFQKALGKRLDALNQIEQRLEHQVDKYLVVYNNREYL